MSNGNDGNDDFGPQSAHAAGTVSRAVKGEQVPGSEVVKTEVVTLDLPPLPPEGPYAEVGVSFGRTINLGDYESVRMDVSIRVPSANTPEATERAYRTAFAWANDKVASFCERVRPKHGKPSGR